MTKKPDVICQIGSNERMSPWVVPGFLVAYTVSVLLIDALATSRIHLPFDWSWFVWRIPALWRLFDESPPRWMQSKVVNAFDLYKFSFWFLIPLGLTYRSLDLSWFSFRPWKQADWFFLILLFTLGGIAVSATRYIPSLREIYGGFGHLSWDERSRHALSYGIWILSWLPGWEFMHRYVVLRAVSGYAPKTGWLLIPVFETTYHFQKPFLEAVGMGLFSVAMTYWALKRKNIVLPFLSHLFIEFALLGILLWGD